MFTEKTAFHKLTPTQCLSCVIDHIERIEDERLAPTRELRRRKLIGTT